MKQTPKRRPKPVTQRDGTALQNANCRMASVSTGLDHHTVGARTSTAGKMRSYTSDQTGGTGSDDAKEAWLRGFKQSLVTKDGGPWSGVIAALKEGRGVNLDVWHALLFSGCISGAGRYGHNIYVHPDFDGKYWLVSDPWCKPGKWDRISEEELRAAAEEWGRRVRAQTGLREPALPVLREAARLLMQRFQPEDEMPFGHPTDTGGRDFETGGYLPIMFTTTNRQPLVTSGKETDDLDKLFGTPGMVRALKVGTPHFNKPGDTTPAGNIKSSLIIYTIVASFTDSAGKVWYCINGGSDGNMNWVRDADVD